MPKFNEKEMLMIKQSLLTEGAKLFTALGLKKVTIDDIVGAVSIAKATFYRFYEGKEYLLLDIVQRQQKEIFNRLNEALRNNSDKTDGERVKEIFFLMSKMLADYPLLTTIDEDTVRMISRKVSQERLIEYSKQGFDAVREMELTGIRFLYETKTVSILFHTLHQAWIGLQEQPEELRNQVISIMLDGIVCKICKN